MRILYHFPASPFARRVRLALLHKGLTFELRDGRADPELLKEARSLNALKTVPVLVEPGGLALGDSTAITHYLDRTYPTAAALWPTAPEDAHVLFEVASLVDVAINQLADLGARYYPLRETGAWESVKSEGLERAQRALDRLGTIVSTRSRPTLAQSGWSAADIWLYTMHGWLAGLPARAPSFPVAAQVLSLGWVLPDAIGRWAEQHQGRDDVRTLS